MTTEDERSLGRETPTGNRNWNQLLLLDPGEIRFGSIHSRISQESKSVCANTRQPPHHTPDRGDDVMLDGI